MGLPSNIIGIMGKSRYLPLTTAWIAATGETDTTILNALNTFEQTLITNSLTSKITAYYPIVGGNATKHAFNFMNTSLYNLTFNGGWTHSATGALPNGTNAYANTGLNASTVLTQSDNHIGFYSRTNAAIASRTAMSAYISGATILAMRLKLTTSNADAYNTSSTATQFVVVANTNSTGMYILSKTGTAAGNLVLYKNGSSIGSNAATITTNAYPNTNVLISAQTAAAQFDDKECAGAIIGLGLTAGQVSTLSTAINTLNTSLSRNTY